MKNEQVMVLVGVVAVMELLIPFEEEGIAETADVADGVAIGVDSFGTGKGGRESGRAASVFDPSDDPEGIRLSSPGKCRG